LTTINARGRRRFYGFVLVLAGCLFFAVRGYQDQRQTLQAFDFKPVYGGARCLIEGCDPYDSMQIERVYLQHGGDSADLRPFRPFNANYPPSALLLVAPLAMLPFALARVLWLGIGMVLFCSAALCVSDLCVGKYAQIVQCVLAAFVVTSTILVMLGQPAMISISLAVIAAWCFLRGRFPWIGVFAFAVSLTFKPHVGALIWLFFLLASRATSADATYDPARMFRRRALQTLGVTLVLMTPGIWLAFHHPASAHWPQELHANLVGIAAHGNASDPGPANDEVPSIANLQALFSLHRDAPNTYNREAIAVFVPLLLAWVYGVMRPVKHPRRLLPGDSGLTASDARNLLALAAAAALCFLPIYHRQYDTRLLLLMFPAVALLASSSRWMGRASVLLSVVATVTMSHQFVHVGLWLVKHGVALRGAVWLVFYRPLPLTLLVLSCFFLYGMFAVGPGEVKPQGGDC
jgi:hypothetical protein